jgi:translation initiation factor 5B
MGKKGKGKAKKKGGKNKGKNSNNGTAPVDEGWDALNDPSLVAQETKAAPPPQAAPESVAPPAADSSAADALQFLNGGGALGKSEESNKKDAPPASSNADAAAMAFLGGAPAESGSGGSKKKKKKKKNNKKEDKKTAAPKNAIAARIKAQQEKKRQEDEEERRFEDEERRKEEEEAAAIAAIAGAKQAKKDAKKARRAQMKADGLIKTKAEKKREAASAAAREKMVAAGMVQLPTGEQKRSRPISKKKKTGPNKMQRKEQERLAEIAAAEARVAELEREKAEAAKQAAANDESSGGDWEDEDEDEEISAVAVDDLKEFSDDDSDEELNEARRGQRLQEKLKKQAEKKKLQKQAMDAAGGDDEEDSGSGEDWENDDDEDEKEAELEEARIARELRNKEMMEQRSASDLRSPILCVLGHVDTGKTKLLDKIRRTNVQDGEAGGITQQIGATYFPMENIKKKTEELNKDFNLDYRVPGLLVIDTPGHESFTNLRSRGSGLCDIAILVIDIMHGLEPQTIESINLLRSRKTPFVVALNKVDRLFGWKVCKDQPIRTSLAQQTPDVIQEFETRTQEVLVQLQEQSLNAKLYYENDDFRRNVSVVPTSAITGEGVPDILLLVVQITQDLMTSRLMYSNAFECTLLEVKMIPGLGTTIDVVLINGVIHESDTIVVCGMNGPIVTPIRALLTPKAMRELRIKSDYTHNKTVKAAMGIKISAQNLDGAIAGTNVMVYRKKDGDNLDEIKQAVMEDFDSVMGNIATVDRGVYVQASTLGALEALLEFLKSEDVNIPVCGVSIGPVHKKDVMKASVMLEHKPEWAVILAFDVKVSADAQQHAEKMGVRIFTADIIYHLQDSFVRYTEEQAKIRKDEADTVAVFPCCLRILKSFREKNPVILGVEVVEGILRVGTPICVPDVKDEEGDPLMIGTVSSIEENHKEKNQVCKGSQVAVKIEAINVAPVTFNRQFNKKSILYSHLTRESIDALKTNFKNDIDRDGWKLVISLKKKLEIT